MKAGDRVVATKDLNNGMFDSGERVPKGTNGVVSQSGGWGADTLVLFKWTTMWGSDKSVEVRVNPGDVA